MARSVIRASVILGLSALGSTVDPGRVSAQDTGKVHLSPGADPEKIWGGIGGVALQAAPSNAKPDFGAAAKTAGGTTLTYFTPSYGHLSTSVAIVPRPNGEVGERSKDYALGVGYGGSLGSFSVETSTALSGTRTEISSLPLSAGGALSQFGGKQAETSLGWKGGVTMGYGGLKLGGLYETSHGSALALGTSQGGPQINETKLTIGGVYDAGPLSVLLAITHGDVDSGGGNAFGSAGSGLTDYHLGANYAFSPGLLLHAGVDYGATNFGPGISSFAGDSPLRDLNSIAVRMGSTLKF